MYQNNGQFPCIVLGSLHKSKGRQFLELIILFFKFGSIKRKSVKVLECKIKV